VETIIGIIIGLILLVALVVLHELGHAIVARRNGVVVEEFGIGFPPKAWGKKLKNGIELTLNWLPLGGFVRMQGEHDAASKPGDYGAASFWQKTRILLAGVAINWLTAAILFSVLALFGLPKLLPNQVVLPFDNRIETAPMRVAGVVDNSPAERAGLTLGSEVLEIDGQPVNSPEKFIRAVKNSSDDTVRVTYQAEGVEQKSVNVQIEANPENGAPYVGVVLQPQREYIYSTYSAPLVGLATTGQLTIETVKGIGVMIGNLASGLVGKLSPDESVKTQADEKLDSVANSVAGPVGILGTLFPSVREAGLRELAAFTALISLTLAVMNTLPIPALDGGRWFTMAAFKVARKPLTKDREEIIQTVGFFALFGLIILVTIGDIGRLL